MDIKIINSKMSTATAPKCQVKFTPMMQEQIKHINIGMISHQENKEQKHVISIHIKESIQ